jgi:hypothetical protein
MSTGQVVERVPGDILLLAQAEFLFLPCPVKLKS